MTLTHAQVEHLPATKQVALNATVKKVKGTPIAPTLKQHFDTKDGDPMNGKNVDPEAETAIYQRIMDDFQYKKDGDGPTYSEIADAEAAAKWARTHETVIEDIPRVNDYAVVKGMVTVEYTRSTSSDQTSGRKIVRILADTTPGADINDGRYYFETNDFPDDIGYDGPSYVGNYADEEDDPPTSSSESESESDEFDFDDE